MSQFEIVWFDRQREPQEPPNPAYPTGIDLDLSHKAADSCRTELPYPAKRCGLWFVKCRRCGMTIAVTTAGRADDPRSLTIDCKRPLAATAAWRG